jgi:integrase/recombinase XerD
VQKIKMKMEKDITIREAYDEFIRKCKVKNYSSYTIKYYHNTIHSFGSFCDLDSPVNIIDEDLINQFILHLQEQDIKEYTVASYIKGIRAIVYFFIEKEYIDEFKVSLTRAEKALKEVYTDSELEILLKKAQLKKMQFHRVSELGNDQLSSGNRSKTEEPAIFKN